ncbi:SDR family oxidoreductase [Rhodococcus sp. CSLK01-03]|uniref:SDR family oxidoreductase n=1 Tax=Rhodococcus indonesiensis TaxID=3055869 RepID=A0ABT7RNY7_9NOCA|nr:SDR family oxidoreductase [Rhodococcus indonesiensis]MDM7489347.1 SDR family oxidoreductase [Rhodococcus indonesiensis]
MSDTAPVAVVTGAGKGIGAAVARRLSDDGYDIAAIDLTFPAEADDEPDTRSRVEATGRRYAAYRADVGDRSECETIADTILADHGRVDALIHVAGISSRGGRIVDTTADELTRLLAVHTLGGFHLARALVPALRSSDNANIVLMSSLATSVPAAGSGPYMMAKAAAEALAYTLALEEAEFGIRVNIVAPGLVATDMGDKFVRAATGLDRAAKLDSGTPFGRVTRAEDVADTVAFLVSESARQITGQRIEVHGGLKTLSTT